MFDPVADLRNRGKKSSNVTPTKLCVKLKKTKAFEMLQEAYGDEKKRLISF